MATNFKKVLLKVKISQGQKSEVSTLPMFDDKEDVYTQTDSISLSRSRRGSAQEFNDSVMRSVMYCKTDFVNPVQYQRRANYFNKNRTLTTMKLLREKHRENERLRHHSLNQHLRLICKKVPGSAKDGKETKVVMMQRIISYIAYLENTIKSLSSQLNIPSDPSWSLLTSSVKEIEKSGLWEFSIMSSDDSEDSDRFSIQPSHGLNLSSSTMNSTAVSTYCQSTPDSRNSAEDNSQDSIVPTASFITDIEGDSTSGFYEDWVVPGNDHKPENLSQSDNDQVILEFPIHCIERTLMDTPEKLEWLGSPDRSSVSNQGMSENHFGIRCDLAGVDDQPYDLSHSIIVSPNQVLPQITVKKPLVLGDNKSSTLERAPHSEGDTMTLCRNSKRKQLSPKRAPLYNIGNWLELPSDCQSHLDELGISLGNSLSMVEEKTSKVGDVIKKVIEEKDNSEVPEIELATESAKVVRDANVELFSTKLDLRKSSWMNGFMMYSRINRKRFIKDNPGLQAASISKLMGQRWRAMTAEQQKPYREQARICSQELQRMLDESYHC
nr:hypothetical protein BgiMline_023700 [Biomphalaria glabrata]